LDFVSPERRTSSGRPPNRVELHIIESSHTGTENLLLAYRPISKTVFIADLQDTGLELIYPSTSPFNQHRLSFLARQLVEFIDRKGWPVERVVAAHGGIDEKSIQLETLRRLASESL
jgi:hypothetical protein